MSFGGGSHSNIIRGYDVSIVTGGNSRFGGNLGWDGVNGGRVGSRGESNFRESVVLISSPFSFGHS